MTISFVANVGTRDVQLKEHPGQPKDPRTLGDMILTDWEKYRGSLAMPIVVKALETVVNRHGPIYRIALFASNQPNADYRHTDTLPFAKIIKRHLMDIYKWAEAALEIIEIQQNPSDYDGMMHFYESALQRFGEDEIVYAEVTGGTPAMSFMLLWQGVEVLQEKVQPLYVLQESVMPRSLNIGQRMMLNTTLDDLNDSLDTYQYFAARRLLETNEKLLRRFWNNSYDAIHAVVEYARSRMNFNFEKALEALFQQDRNVQPSQAQRIIQLADDIRHRDAAWMLSEVYFTAQISFETGAYADFLGRAFRLSEGLTEFFVEQWLDVSVETVFEIEYSEKFGRQVARKMRILPEWISKNPDLQSQFERERIDSSRDVNRHILLALAAYLAGEDDKRKNTVRRLRRFGELGDYRNQMPFAHGFAGVSLERLKELYGTKKDDEMLWHLRGLVGLVTGDMPKESPYDTINSLIRDLIEGAT